MLTLQRKMSRITEVAGDPGAESSFRENPRHDEGIFLQEYFVYFKKKCQNQGVDCPEDAERDGITVNLQYEQAERPRA